MIEQPPVGEDRAFGAVQGDRDVIVGVDHLPRFQEPVLVEVLDRVFLHRVPDPDTPLRSRRHPEDQSEYTEKSEDNDPRTTAAEEHPDLVAVGHGLTADGE